MMKFVFALFLMTTVLLPLQAQEKTASLTAKEVMQHIIAATGATPPGGTVDTLKAGDPDTVATGIVTTFMDTYPVLEKAVAEGKNLIITHEPTFYNHRDDQSILAGDPVQAQKLAYINEHHLVVWRFHDTWHLRHPDGILAGMMDELGWKPYQSTTNPHLFTLPAITVGKLATELRNKTGSHSVRIVGNPNMTVTQIGFLPGAAGLEAQVKMLERDDVQVLVAGESTEWEGIEYAQDASAERRHKALILIGHEISEEDGMKYCAQWLKTILPGMPIEFIRAGDPFQTPESLSAQKH